MTARPRRGGHRAPRRWVRTRVVLSLGLLLGLGALGTTAYWTDTATVTSGGFTSGTMDLQLSSTPEGLGAVGLGTDYNKTSMTWSGLTPGERKAFTLQVRNVGNPPLTYTATVTRGSNPAWTYVGSPITVQVFAGTAVADTTYPVQETCTGASLGSLQALDATNKAVVSPAQRIAAGANQDICVVVGLDAAADNQNQGRTGSLNLAFSAAQAVS